MIVKPKRVDKLDGLQAASLERRQFLCSLPPLLSAQGRLIRASSVGQALQRKEMARLLEEELAKWDKDGEEDMDPEYESCEDKEGQAQAQAARALDIGLADITPDAEHDKPSPFVELAKLGYKTLLELGEILTKIDGTLISHTRAKTVLKELADVTVTRETLTKGSKSVVLVVKQYKKHTDVPTRVMATALLENWRTIWNLPNNTSFPTAKSVEESQTATVIEGDDQGSPSPRKSRRRLKKTSSTVSE